MFFSSRRPGRLLEFLLTLALKPEERFQVLGDFAEIYHEIARDKGGFKARCWYGKQIFKSLPAFLVNYFVWGFVMLKNYFKIFYRRFRRQAGYAVISLLGLAVGITCAWFIFIYVGFESHYDHYHRDVDRIYRVARFAKTPTTTVRTAHNSIMTAFLLRRNFPQVESAVRIRQDDLKPVRYGDRIFYEDNIKIVEPEIFDIFALSFLRGETKSALSRPHTAVITERVAEKYFGDDDPVGKVLIIGGENFEITGIIRNPPGNTHMKAAILISFITYKDGVLREEWGTHAPCYTYIKLAEGVDPAEFEKLISGLIHQHDGGEAAQRGTQYSLFLQPVKDIHLHSDLRWELEPPGKPGYLLIFSAVGVLILLIAALNFMNLVTARSVSRAREVGMRKVIGAGRLQLIKQFLGESLFMSVGAFLVSAFLVVCLLPGFNRLAGTNFAGGDVFRPDILPTAVIVILLIGFLSGSYPAFFLSSLRPVFSLRGDRFSHAGGAGFRKFLVIGQFSISIFLSIGTLMIYRQLNYMRSQFLGFEKEQKLIIRFAEGVLDGSNCETVKTSFLNLSGISSACVSSSVPGRYMYYWRLWPFNERETRAQTVNCFSVDKDFLNTYKIDLAAGTGFLAGSSVDDSSGDYLLSESAVRAFGWNSPEEALGKPFMRENSFILGVFKDFHARGLQEEIGPLVLVPYYDLTYLSLTVDTRNLDRIIAVVTKQFKELFPGSPLEYFFLDSDFDRQYRAEENLGRIFGVFAFLGLVIACLGLVGLAAFMVERRTKEIGVRKILGSTSGGIILLINREFIRWVVYANVITWPLAYWAAGKWLQSFAYRTGIRIDVFLSAGLLAVLLALLTVSVQSVRAANTNPVDSLRYE